MNEALIERHNSVVKENDWVYNLGDFCWDRKPERWANHLWRLKGKIMLIKGNHDRQQTINKLLAFPGIEKKLLWVKDYYKLTVQDKSAKHGKNILILMHYAMRVWDRAHWGTMHCYGHSHGGLPEDPVARSMDVGVDTNNYYPYSYEEVRDYLMSKPGNIIKKKQ